MPLDVLLELRLQLGLGQLRTCWGLWPQEVPPISWESVSWFSNSVLFTFPMVSS